MAQVPIRYTDPSQQSDALQKVAVDVSKILTQNEEILYIALQNKTALSIRKDSVVATSNRVICYKPGILGRVAFEDYLWQDVKEARISQGFLSTDFTVETVKGQRAILGGLDRVLPGYVSTMETFGWPNCTGMKRTASARRKSSASGTSTDSPRRRALRLPKGARFVVCVNNDGHQASLERNKIYVVLPDAQAEASGDLRVIDESGEDYLFAAKRFVAVELPRAVQTSVRRAS